MPLYEVKRYKRYTWCAPQQLAHFLRFLIFTVGCIDMLNILSILLTCFSRSRSLQRLERFEFRLFIAFSFIFKIEVELLKQCALLCLNTLTYFWQQIKISSDFGSQLKMKNQVLYIANVIERLQYGRKRNHIWFTLSMTNMIYLPRPLNSIQSK